MAERLLWEQEAAGSNPVTPIERAVQDARPFHRAQHGLGEAEDRGDVRHAFAANAVNAMAGIQGRGRSRDRKSSGRQQRRGKRQRRRHSARRPVASGGGDAETTKTSSDGIPQ